MPEERREQVTRVVIEQSQRLTGGTRRSRWKAAAFNGWHEPDKSRGLCPESVSGSGCKPPGRLGLGVQIPPAYSPSRDLGAQLLPFPLSRTEGSTSNHSASM